MRRIVLRVVLGNPSTSPMPVVPTVWPWALFFLLPRYQRSLLSFPSCKTSAMRLKNARHHRKIFFSLSSCHTPERRAGKGRRPNLGRKILLVGRHPFLFFVRRRRFSYGLVCRVRRRRYRRSPMRRRRRPNHTGVGRRCLCHRVLSRLGRPWIIGLQRTLLLRTRKAFLLVQRPSRRIPHEALPSPTPFPCLLSLLSSPRFGFPKGETMTSTTTRTTTKKKKKNIILMIPTTSSSHDHLFHG